MIKDKLKHIGVNFAIVAILGYWGILIAVMFSIGKELYDKFVKKTFIDYRDIEADAVGIGLGVILLILKGAS